MRVTQAWLWRYRQVKSSVASADLKHLFKSAATQAGNDPLGAFYQNLLAGGMEPAMARLTLARKIAAIALKIWKKALPPAAPD